MNLHKWAMGVLALLAVSAACPAICAVRPAAASRTSAPARAHLSLFGIRTAQQRQSEMSGKFDSALADLIRRAPLARPGHVLEDLRTMSPAMRIMQRSPDTEALVLVDAVTRGDPQQLKRALTSLGLQEASVYSNDVSGWLPVAQIEAAAARTELHSIRAAMLRTRVGAVTTQGDFVQNTATLRQTYSTLTGSGVTVGVISDSYNCYPVFAANGVPASGDAGYASNGFLATAATDMTSGDLPMTVDVVREATCMSGTHYNGYPDQLPFGDEGRAMMQIVHDVAPGANLSFYTAENGEADFAAGIKALAKAGASVIADDVGYFDEPFYQDGLVAQAIDAVESQGVAYFSAAGNDSNNSNQHKHAWESTAPSFGTPAGAGPMQGEFLLNFDTTAATTTTTLPVTIPSLSPGEFMALVVEWDQPYVTGSPGSPGASSSIDLCVTASSGNDLNGCTGPNTVGKDPVQILTISNPANSGGDSASETISISIGLAGGTTGPNRIRLLLSDGGAGASITKFATDSATLQGHPGAAGAAAVGAAFFFLTPACGTTPTVIESFSSQGGSPTLFDASGNRLATPVVRQKPDFVGPDGGNDTFLGFTLASTSIAGSDGLLPTNIAQCQNNPSYPNFFGTSAATPHAAAIAALMLQANPAVTPTQIYDALRNSAAPMVGTTPNFTSGYGFIQADAALARLPPGPPTLTLAASSVAAGSSTTLTWTSVNTTSCTASGSWSGTQKTSGSMMVTPSAAGTAAYTLTCVNAVGSASSTANLTVTAGGGGGGGALDELTLLFMAGVGFARAVRGRRRGRDG